MDPKTLLRKMSRIQYGFLLRDGTIISAHDPRIEDPVTFYHQSRIMTPSEVWKYKLGTCWDQTLLEWYELTKENKVSELKGFYFELFDKRNADGQSHTGVTYRWEHQYWYFENAWADRRGIHGPFETHKQAIGFITRIAIENSKKKYFWIDDAIDFSSIVGKHQLYPEEFLQFCYRNYRESDRQLIARM